MIPSTLSPFGKKEWQWQMRQRADQLRDYEQGSAALNDTAGGLSSHLWTAEFSPTTGDVSIYRDGVAPTVLFNKPGITRIGLAFDQNMRPAVCYSHPDGPGLWYYSATASGNIFFPTPGALYPCISLDDRRPEGISDSDVILTYTKSDNKLYCRVQRESYAERLLYSGLPNTELVAFGMTKELRLQWRLANA